MKIQYTETSFKARALDTIEHANSIIEEYQEQGYSLTLRQLYYQFVSRDLIANKQSEYKRLGEVISAARRAGLVDWDAIVDRTRFLRTQPSWSSPVDIVESCASQFKYDPWETQDFYVEVWFEKDAVLGIFERAAKQWRLPLFSCRGYVSDSEAWAAAQRLSEKADRYGKKVIVLHFGDHDTSGIDMTRDLDERFRLFGATEFQVRRLALNMEQVRKFNPPPNPAKETDSRFGEYLRKYGDESWELDALEPRVLDGLVQREVEAIIDSDAWDECMKKETEARRQLSGVASNWKKITRRF